MGLADCFLSIRGDPDLDVRGSGRGRADGPDRTTATAKFVLEADLDLMCAVAVWMTMQTRSFGAGHISMVGGQSWGIQ